MYRKIWIIVALVVFLASGSAIAKKTETSFTWNRGEHLMVTATGDRVDGCDEFVNELRKIIPGANKCGSRHLLDFTENSRDLKSLVSRHTIFTIRPEELEQLESLKAKCPKLVPFSCDELKSYCFPLLYFSRDDKGKIRGVIIAGEVTPLLAKLLTKNVLPLNVAFWYEDGQIKELVVGCGITYPSVLPASLETVRLKPPLSMIHVSKGEKIRGNWEEFIEGMRKFLNVSIDSRPNISTHSRPSPVPVGKSLKWLTRNTIYFINPKNLECLQDLEAKYPQLLPLSCQELESKLESYSPPLFYFSRDIEADKIRGIVVARRVDPPLAETLSKYIPLDISFRYDENGHLRILE
jgi:hypothetical protein